MTWQPISEAPLDTEVLIWLKADDGMDEPIGAVVALYDAGEFWTGWNEKSVAGGYNLGLRQDLITHFQLIKAPENDDITI